MKLIAAMIVKNESECILKCINSLVKEGIDEIIICDTGSTDDTIVKLEDAAIALKENPPLFIYTDYTWEDSFAKARNHVLGKVPEGEWVISIDADEEIMPGSLALIKKTILEHPDVVSIGITLRSEGTRHETVAPRVFKKCPEVFWQGAAHNYLSKKAQIAIPEAVIEYGYSPTHRVDPDRTLRILRKAVEADPDKPREIYYLAREYYYRKQWKVAINWYDKYLAVSSWAPEMADAWLIRAKCLLNLGRKLEARESAVMALRLIPGFKEVFEFLAGISDTKYEKLQWLRYALAATNLEVLFVRTKPVYNTSIIIMTKDSHTIEECVRNVLQSTMCPTEVIVVNGGGPLPQLEGVRVIDTPDMTLTQQIRQGVSFARADYVVAFCDDHFPEEGWLEIAYHSYHAQFPDGIGVLCLNEGFNYRGQKACVTLTNKKTIEQALRGVWYDTAFHQYRCDVDLALRASKTGRYAYCGDAVVLHKHKNASNNMGKHWAHDAQVFEERWGVKKEGVKNAVEA